MKKILVQTLTAENFLQYGTFVDLYNFNGANLGEGDCTFYPDVVNMSVSPNVAMSFSVLKVNKPDKYIVKSVEFHRYTGEGILCINDDVVLYVAPPCDSLENLDSIVAFLIPKGTFVRLNAEVWHYAPLPANEKVGNLLIVLPQRTYANDCYLEEFEEDKWIEIEVVKE